MNFGNYTQKSLEAVQLARQLAVQNGHQQLEQLHLLAALLRHKGPAILSGYPSDLYDRELKNWHRITRKSYNQHSDPRTEVLWCNFEVGQITMEDLL